MLSLRYAGLAWRYSLASGRRSVIGFIAWASIVGIALGVMAMITVLSVMNGFESSLTQRVLAQVPHVTLYAYRGESVDWSWLQQQLADEPQVVESTLFWQGQGLLTHAADSQGVQLLGVDWQTPRVQQQWQQRLTLGQLPQAGEVPEVVISAKLAKALQLSVGDMATLVVPKARQLRRLPTLLRAHVVGVVSSDSELNAYVVALAMPVAAERLQATPSGVWVKVQQLQQAPELAPQWAQRWPELYVTNWTRQYRNLFHSISTVKKIMFLVLSLVVAVAVFNIVSTLVIMVQDKQADIAILRTLGASPQGILWLFLWQGVWLSSVGLVLGVLGGIGLSLSITYIVSALEYLLGQQLVNTEVYHVAHLPAELHAWDVGAVMVMTLLIALLACMYPAWRASRSLVVEGLRHE